jgi:hypothetical protein
MKKLIVVLILGLAGTLLWVVELRRRLYSAQMRGDMYRDISMRLDRRLVEQNEHLSPSSTE